MEEWITNPRPSLTVYIQRHIAYLSCPGEVDIFPARGRRRRWRCWKWWWRRGADRGGWQPWSALSTSNIGNVKTVNKNKLLPSTRRHTTCKDMAAGRKPDTQEDFPSMCEKAFHRYGNTQKLWFLCLCSLHSYCRRFESRPMVILNVESPLKKCCATLHWISY